MKGVVTGKAFNVEKTILVKFLKPDMKAYGYQYKLGLNEDYLVFNRVLGDSGGLHFTNLSGVWSPTDRRIFLVSVPDDSIVVANETRSSFKTNKLILEKEISLKEYETLLDSRKGPDVTELALMVMKYCEMIDVPFSIIGSKCPGSVDPLSLDRLVSEGLVNIDTPSLEMILKKLRCMSRIYKTCIDVPDLASKNYAELKDIRARAKAAKIPFSVLA